METIVQPCCPSCAKDETVRIGKLPDSNLFAGVFLDRDLAGGSLYKCKICSLTFRYPIDDAMTHEELYDNQKTLTWSLQSERPDWELIARHVSEHKTRGRVLDFGCYTGGLLALLEGEYERYGIEINRAAAAEAAKIAGRPIFSSVEEVPEQLRFDVIIACDVVEHMVDPVSIIRELGHLLSENGILILTTGDSENSLWNRFGANWWYCYFPEHISFISKTWLDLNAENLGLSLLHCETFKYAELKPAAKPIHVALTYFYGWFPDLYLRLRKFTDTLRGKPGTNSVTGVGVTDDHLIAIMSSGRQQKLRN